ncbi:MAG: type III-B CRISPR-associated protein Cas10/Cmr2 [Rhodospirillales bacterium]|nr:type III-B CRISPR-associated protein Cas10/Cmr2 [Rhodospirillales bacterium]
MADKWDDLLCVFLHDPPDKVLAIGPHETRTAAYIEAAVGRPIDPKAGKRAQKADVLAAIAERPTMPSNDKAAEVDYAGLVFHPLDPIPRTYRASLDEEDAKRQIGRITGSLESQKRFLALWRLLPERLPQFARLPAETRAPDHTIWHHLDITAGLHAARMDSNDGALLTFQLGPVQSFVEAARSVRDLWTGSAILSWLTFQAMLPIIEELGPTALVFPSLRGAPLMDLWLRDRLKLSDVPLPDTEARKAPSIPNRFFAIAPWGDDGANARRLAGQCEERANSAWKLLADAVKRRLDPELTSLCAGWAGRWDDQIKSVFEVRTACLPALRSSEDERHWAGLLGGTSFDATWPPLGAARSLSDCIPDANLPGGARARSAEKRLGRWQVQVEFAGRLLEASRAIRRVPLSTATTSSGDGQYPNKCTLFGSYEQMGPNGLGESASFWQLAKEVKIEGVRLGKRDRFCAVALAKRFAAPAFLAAELGLQPEDVRIPDTWTVAAATWLKRSGMEDWKTFRGDGGQRWNGQWLHWRTQHDDEDEDRIPNATWAKIIEARSDWKGATPPIYYAILKMDADEIGAWLRGEKAPRLRETLHPQTRAYFEVLAGSELGLAAWRPVGPALHAAISEALANFAVHVVPHVVAKHAGTVIYAGGDDVLALLPVETALCCAWELRRAFGGLQPVNGFADDGYWRGSDGRERLMMGPRASLSAGMAVLHAKDDLREGLQAARKAEKQAKNGGRDALVLTVQRRSGERTSVLAAWDTALWLEEMRTAFASGASDRWAYRLREEEPTLGALPQSAILAEVRRQVDRSEEVTRIRLGGGNKNNAGERVSGALSAYDRMRRGRKDAFDQGEIFRDFLTLCQSASFLARGRD